MADIYKDDQKVDLRFLPTLMGIIAFALFVYLAASRPNGRTKILCFAEVFEEEGQPVHREDMFWIESPRGVWFRESSQLVVEDKNGKQITCKSAYFQVNP